MQATPPELWDRRVVDYESVTVVQMRQSAADDCLSASRAVAHAGVRQAQLWWLQRGCATELIVVEDLRSAL